MEKDIARAYEKQLIGRILQNKDVLYENADAIEAELFYYNEDIFDAIQKCIKEGKHPGLVKIMSMVPDKRFYIQESIKEIDFSIPLSDMIETLDEERKNRLIDNKLLTASTKKTSQEKIEAITSIVTSIHAKEKSDLKHGFEVAKEALKHLETKTDTGIPSGFRYFDKMAGGWQPTDLVIMAGETSMGKTSLALCTAQHIIDSGHGLAIISLEMSNRQLIERMILTKAEVPKKEALQNLTLIQNVACELEDKPFYIGDVTNNSFSHISGLVRSAVMRHDVKVVVIDYLQLIKDNSGGNKNREQEVGQIARGFKNLAKELNITVILLSQLRRAGDGNHYPTLSRLRDSGQIEEAADLVWFIYRPEYYGIDEDSDGNSTHQVAEHIIAKGRNVGTGKFKTKFQEEFTKFSDYGEIEYREPWQDNEREDDRDFGGVHSDGIRSNHAFSEDNREGRQTGIDF